MANPSPGHSITLRVAAPTSFNASSDLVAAVAVHKSSDRTFLLHLGGKLESTPKVPLRNRDDLSRADTPRVARVCQAVADNPEEARRLTIKRNTVAVVTDGSAVLGLGYIGPVASMPVMEGEAVLFKQFADVDAWPVALDTQDPEEIIAACKALAPAYGESTWRTSLRPEDLRAKPACGTSWTFPSSTTISVERRSRRWRRVRMRSKTVLMPMPTSVRCA